MTANENGLSFTSDEVNRMKQIIQAQNIGDGNAKLYKILLPYFKSERTFLSTMNKLNAYDQYHAIGKNIDNKVSVDTITQQIIALLTILKLG